jgi:L-cysteine desulfidase
VRCLIEGNHTNLALLEHNGQTIYKSDSSTNNKGNSNNSLDFATILKFVYAVEQKELQFLEDSWKMNLQIARAGLKNPHKNFCGVALQKQYADKQAKGQLGNLHILNHIKALTAAACDARMNGLDYPVAAVAGSGNQGITAIVPIAALAEINNIDPKKVLRAIALSALITVYVKSKIGVLTPVCGCAIAAGAGSAAAMAYLLGGSAAEIEAAVINVSGGLAGMVCDGAKGGCAFKLAVAAAAAYDAAMLALEEVVIQPLDGLVGSNAEETITNVAYFVNEGMKCADEALVYIMEEQLSEAGFNKRASDLA